MGDTNHDSAHVVRWTYITFALLMGAWIIAWLLKLQLDQISGGGTSLGSFIYWTSAKVLIWILPAFWLIKLSGRSLGQIFNITNYRGWLLWGGGIGLAIALISFVSNYLNNKPFLLSITFSFALLNVLVIAPIFEEFLLRGAVLGNLQQRHPFWRANFLCSLMFVVLHLPGWYFAGSLVENVTRLVGGAASVFGVSLLFGYVVKRSDSVIASMIAHFLTNLH
jgi:uncharacterized protein